MISRLTFWGIKGIKGQSGMAVYDLEGLWSRGNDTQSMALVAF